MQPKHKICFAYLVGVTVIILTAKLGLWQWQRAAEKSKRMEQWTQAMQASPLVWQSGALPAMYQRVELTGQWLLSEQILLDNRFHQGQPGFHVITPFLLSPSQDHQHSQAGTRRIIVINRGWIARPRQGLPVIASPLSHTVQVRREPLPRFFELQHDTHLGRVWQNLDWPRYQTKIGAGVQPFYTVAISDLADGLQRDWPTPDLGISRHHGYAAQWFGLSLLGTGLLVFFALRQFRRRLSQKARHG